MSSTQSKFPFASREDWHALVSAALKGGDPQSLDRLDEDGLAIKALYDITSNVTPSTDACAITRLPVNPASHIAHGWDICQPVMADGSAKDINWLILDELHDGVGTIWLQGLQTANLVGQLPAMMQDVVFAAVGIHLDAGNDVMAQIAAFAGLPKRPIPIWRHRAFMPISILLPRQQMLICWQMRLHILCRQMLVMSHQICFAHRGGNGIIRA
jgi:hypothetical protein